MNEIINLGNGQFVKVCMLKGESGSNIQNIAKTSTQGLVDTYTITLTDGSTQTFTVTNGKSIVSIEKTATNVLVDTYTITFNDNTTTTFNVTNGKGISTIEKTTTQDLVDTYTITFNDGTTTTFDVTNGSDGADGVGISSIAKTSTSGLVDTYTITYTNGQTSTFDVTNGANGQDVSQSNLAPVETGNTASQSYAVGKHLVWNGVYYKVIQAIAIDDAFNIGVNLQPDTISQDIDDIYSLFDYDGTLVSTSDGGKMTPEKVVGKWIDGSDVYRATFMIKFSKAGYSNHSISANSSNYYNFFFPDGNQSRTILKASGSYWVTTSNGYCIPNYEKTEVSSSVTNASDGGSSTVSIHFINGASSTRYISCIVLTLEYVKKKISELY